MVREQVIGKYGKRGGGAGPQNKLQAESPQDHEVFKGNHCKEADQGYFEAVFEERACLVYHQPGSQLISLDSKEKAPMQADILAALQATELYLHGIDGLQNAGYNRCMLYPVYLSTPLLECTEFMVKRTTAHVSKTPPFE
ncbi:hypothetical protein ACJMK2_023282 [Sinanodonta woodiana]|uniref:Uncharacterized protein n=1 Tax=Sinanodonta woodiana TaxID=1069815 RepID=A0ABD3T4I7_SINWO